MRTYLFKLTLHVSSRGATTTTTTTATNDKMAEQKAAEIIAGNQDLAAELLIHLPARFLAKFKWVSELWLSIISNPHFISMHTIHKKPLLCGLILHSFSSTSTPKSTFFPSDQGKYDESRSLESFLNLKNFRILQSCNGLLLLRSTQNAYFICNPTTCQYREVTLPFEDDHMKDLALSLAFDPTKSLSYKVVFVQKTNGKLHSIRTLSSETKDSVADNIQYYDPDGVDFKNGVFCNGAVHWINGFGSCIFFHVDGRYTGFVPGPHRRGTLEYFGECNGNLYLVISVDSLGFLVYKMEDYRSGWCLRYEVDLRESLGWVLPPRCSVLGVVSREGSDKDMRLVLSGGGEVVAVRAEDCTCRKLCKLENECQNDEFVVFQYLDTLCPI